MNMARTMLATAVILAASAGWAADYVWTGASTAVDKTWADAANWTVNGEPTDTWPKTAEDTATFNTSCVPVRNEEAIVGEIILNANVTLRFDKWLTVGKISGSGELILMNRGRLRNISGTSLTCNNNIRITSSDSTDCGNHSAMPYIQANGAEFHIAGKLLGDSHVFFTMSGYFGVHLDGDNSEFTGTIHIDSNSNNRVKIGAESGSPANGRYIIHGWTGDNGGLPEKASGGTYKFGSIYTSDRNINNYPFRFKNLSDTAILEIGALHREDDRISIRMGENNGTTGQAKIKKVGTGTLELWHTGHIRGTEIAGGTLLVTSADALNGRTDNSTSVNGDCTISFTGGTLKYGTDEWTDANNPAAVTTDWSGLVKNSTGFISVDTGTNEVTWASGSLHNNNPDAKGVVKKGAGTWRLSGTNRDGSWNLFTDAAKTTTIEEGTLEIMNAKYNDRFTINSTILGNGTLRILPEEHDGAVYLAGTEAFANFEGTLEWANDITQAKFASGFRMVDHINFEMPKAKMRITGNPAEPTCVMLCETQWNPNAAHVTVGAFDHLHPNAEIRCDRSAWTLNILGTAGDSYLNGVFTTNAVTIVKTGTGKLTMGPGFSAPEGSAIRVNEGVFAMDAGMTAENLPSYLTIASGVKLTGEGVFGAVDLSVNDVALPDLTAETNKSTVFTLLTATSITGDSAAMATLLAQVNATDTKGKWKVLKVDNGNGTVSLKCVWSRNAFMVILR